MIKGTTLTLQLVLVKAVSTTAVYLVPGPVVLVSTLTLVFVLGIIAKIRVVRRVRYLEIVQPGSTTWLTSATEPPSAMVLVLTVLDKAIVQLVNTTMHQRAMAPEPRTDVKVVPPRAPVRRGTTSTTRFAKVEGSVTIRVGNALYLANANRVSTTTPLPATERRPLTVPVCPALVSSSVLLGLILTLTRVMERAVKTVASHVTKTDSAARVIFTIIPTVKVMVRRTTAVSFVRAKLCVTLQTSSFLVDVTATGTLTGPAFEQGISGLEPFSKLL